MEEDKIKEILDEKQEPQQQVHQQKRTFWNNKKTVKGKALSAWLIVMIAIFMLFTFGLGIYFGKEVFAKKEDNGKSNNENNTNTVVDNNNNENDNTNTTDNNDSNEIIAVDINDTEVQKLLSYFGYDKEKCFLFGEVLNTDNLARLRTAYDNIPNSYVETVSCSGYEPVLKSQSGTGIYGYCGSIMNSEMSKYYANGDMDAFTKAASNNVTKKIAINNFKNNFESLFSSNYQFTPADFGYGADYTPGCQTAKYYQDKQEYVMYSGECGGTCGVTTQAVLKAYKQGNKLYIETEFTGESGYKTNINYEFVLEGNSYKFSKVTESK